jgi:hypothetical protein
MALDLSKCYRAKVIDSNYKHGGAGVAPGSVKVNVEDWNADSGKPAEIWAYPLNAFFVGSDTGKVKNSGQCIIPPIGSDVWVAWEDPVEGTDNGGIAWYFGSGGFNNRYTIPNENRTSGSPNEIYTLLQTPRGRTILMSDENGSSKIVIKGRGTATGPLVEGNNMALILDESNHNIITLQSGNGKQSIVINKDSNTTTITQGNSKITMDNSNINIETSGTINLKAGRINLNS